MSERLKSPWAWVWDEDREDWAVIHSVYDQYGKSVAVLAEHIQFDGDAQLIAQAPVLLRVLTDLSRAWKADTPDPAAFNLAMDDAETLLATLPKPEDVS